MASVSAFRGIRYNPELVRLGGVLAPPYDVISDSQRDALYGRNLRNIVRIDFGVTYPNDVPGVADQYTRAAAFLDSWLQLGILVRDSQPAMYVTDHEFTQPDGTTAHRRGVFAVVAARPWSTSDLKPHERTMIGPKQDRLALLQATHVQTSPVFALWTGATSLRSLIDAVVTDEALLGGRIDGELGSEKVLVWRVSDPNWIAAAVHALTTSALYVADGHHRYETSVTFGASHCLVHLAAADDPALTILPTHRLVHPGAGVAFSLDDLWARLDDDFEAEPADDVRRALALAQASRATHHAFAVVARDGAAVLRRPRRVTESVREALDAAVLEDEVLGPAGVSAPEIERGALSFTRDAEELSAAVQRGDAVLGFGMLPAAAAEVIAVADAAETMPQKSTYFYPKVPTGLMLLPV
jgi:uncharacterized protein (DUF1015 family)